MKNGKPKKDWDANVDIKKRESDINRYLENPKICKHCNNIIQVSDHGRVRDTKAKTFCNRFCAALYNSKLRIKIEKPPKVKKLIKPKAPMLPNGNKLILCKICNLDFEINYSSRQEICENCHAIIAVENKTKGEIFKSSKNWQSARTAIRKHAVSIYKKSGKPYECFNCGYSIYVEVCHIKPVSSFHEDTRISEINDESNLIALCKRCHWEFDNGFLSL